MINHLRINISRLLLRNSWYYPFICSVIVSLMSFRDINIKYIAISLTIGCSKFFLHEKKIFKALIHYSGIFLAFYFSIKEFGTIFHIEGGFSFIMVLSGLKLLEAKSKRDLFVFYNMLFLVTCSQVIFVQTLISTITSIMSLLIIFAGINFAENKTFNLPKLNNIFNFSSLKYVFFSAMILVIFFIFFPRFEIGFMRFNQKFSKTGFSPDANPGQSDTLLPSDDIAFKVKFNDSKKVAMADLYWVGSVLTRNDGYRWKLFKSANQQDINFIQNQNNILKYTIYSETMTHKYLFSLDKVLGIPSINLAYKKIAAKTFQLNRTYTQKISYSFSSYLEENKEKKFTLDKRIDFLAYPESLKNLSLFKNLTNRFKHDDNKIVLENILNYFSSSGFVYTLSPGRTNTLSEFLVTKKGFCSHFASAFSLLARMSGIPSRVVVGYQGGEYNEFDNILTVKQKDAHAWSEIYLEDEGWIRYDPVSVVQPARILHGGQVFFDNQNSILDGTYINGLMP